MNYSAFDKGWDDGYNDRTSSNPYLEGTENYDEYEAGYEAGCRDR